MDGDIDNVNFTKDFAFHAFFQIIIYGLEFISRWSNKANTGSIDYILDEKPRLWA